MEDDVGVELKDTQGGGLLDHPFEVLDQIQEHWLGSFILNVLGYALIVIPAALLIRKWKNDPAVRRGEKRRIACC